MGSVARAGWIAGWMVAGCAGAPEDETETVPEPLPVESTPVAGPVTPEALAAGETSVFRVTGLDDAVAWRITLVLSDLVTTAEDGAATFRDDDGNGAADPGASEFVARIVRVGEQRFVPGQKTVPSVNDDPADPSGIYPVDGVLEVEIEGVGTGAIRPVAYHNGGASTFLEVDGAGAPTETHVVGDPITVDGPPPTVAPNSPRTVAPGESLDVTLTDVSDLVAYRVTLVVADNVTPGPDQTGTFVDLDANGYADAGPSETVALISQVNGEDLPSPGKTVPAPEDDPANPTGVYPTGGVLTVRVTGVAAGTVVPVAYVNGGATTFLELDPSGTPTEAYAVGAPITVD